MSAAYKSVSGALRLAYPGDKCVWLAVAVLTTIFSLYLVWTEQSVFEAQLLLLGIGLGVCLYQASFGFSTAWRRLITERKADGVRAQLVMLSLGVLLFFPVLGAGEFFGASVNGFVRPLGLSVIFGSFIFGIGMQIANGCASGNLYHLGGGQLRAIPVILGFAAGALWATLDYEWWTSLPQLAPVSLIDELGTTLAIGLNLTLFALIYLFTKRLEKGLNTAAGDSAQSSSEPFWRRLIVGPWPMIWGGIGLAVLNFVTLITLGRPWAVAIAYPVWGAKISEQLGMDLELDFTTFWMQPGRDTALTESVLADSGSLMNFGVVIGAFLAAAVARRFSLSLNLSFRQLIGALLGGVMLGYGATIAFGCNIGAFVGGVLSGSLHGWLWIAFALAGSFVGTRIRPLLRLG